MERRKILQLNRFHFEPSLINSGTPPPPPRTPQLPSIICLHLCSSESSIKNTLTRVSFESECLKNDWGEKKVLFCLQLQNKMIRAGEKKKKSFPKRSISGAQSSRTALRKEIRWGETVRPLPSFLRKGLVRPAQRRLTAAR